MSLDEHYADEAERAEYEARRRWEDSGMNVPEYILSRIEDGEPSFDLEWETMREAAHDEAEGRFAARRLVDVKESTLSASAGSANLALPQGRTEESASSTGSSIANSADGAQGGRAKFAVAVESLTVGKKNAKLSDVDQKRLTAVMRGLGTGELRHPRFTKEEAAASQGTEHEQLWNYILSLESPDVHGGGTEALGRGERGQNPQGGGRLGRLGRVATRYGSDPKEIAARDHKYLDRGAESRVYLRNNETVIKVRRLDAYDMDGVKHALAKIVYHNYLFPKDAYRLQDIVVWKNERGFDEYYMILEQPLVTPKRDADGNIIAPSQGHILQALKKTGQKFNVTGGYYDNGDTTSGSSSGDVVESAKMVAASGDYAVYDFKPGRNTFLDSETGEVRFIDPRIDINDPTDNFAYSKFGKRRRTDAGFDADRQIGNRAAAKNTVETPWSAEDEVRYREQQEANAAIDDADFNGQPSGNGEGKFAVRKTPVRVPRDEYARISSLVTENEAKAAKAGVEHPPTGIVRTSRGIYIYDHFSDSTFRAYASPRDENALF